MKAEPSASTSLVDALSKKPSALEARISFDAEGVATSFSFIVVNGSPTEAAKAAYSLGIRSLRGEFKLPGVVFPLDGVAKNAN